MTSIARTNVQVLEHDARLWLSVEQELHAPPADEAEAEVFLDLRGCPFVPRDIAGSASSRPYQEQWRLAFPRAAEASWNGSTLTYSLEDAEPRTAGWLLAVPAMLPRFAGGSWRPAPQPELRVVLDELLRDVEICTLRSESPVGSDVLAVAAVKGGRPLSEHVIAAARLSETLERSGQSRCVCEHISLSLKALATVTGIAATKRVIVAAPEDLAPYEDPAPLVVVLQPGDLAMLRKHGEAFSYEMTHRLAESWWGGGCRVVNNEWGLTSSLALAAHAEIDSRYVMHVRRVYARLARRIVWPWSSARRRRTVHEALVATSLQRMHGAQLGRVHGTALRELWGMETDANGALARVGIARLT